MHFSNETQTITHNEEIDAKFIKSQDNPNVAATLSNISDQPLTKESQTYASNTQRAYDLDKYSSVPLTKVSAPKSPCVLPDPCSNDSPEELSPEQCAIFFSENTSNLSIQGKLYGHDLFFLVDTGAAVTSVSERLWSQLPPLT